MAHLKKTTCELKLEVASLRSSLDDAEFTKRQLQKQLQLAQTALSSVNKTPSVRGK